MGNANFADCTYKKEFMDISVIVPLYNEAESLPELEAWIERVMKANGFSYEIIFVNDGSTDASWKVINDLKAKSAAVKGFVSAATMASRRRLTLDSSVPRAMW